MSVTALPGYLLEVVFDNGEKRRFDASPLLHRRCYEKLRNEAVFASAFVQYGCVTWDDETDIDPDWLYEDSVSVT